MTVAVEFDTAGDLIGAAGTALALLTAHSALPAPDVAFRWVARPDGATLPPGWGVRMSLHQDMPAFEQWRCALGIDPAAIESKRSGALGWLTATVTYGAGALELIGFYNLPAEADAE